MRGRRNWPCSRSRITHRSAPVSNGVATSDMQTLETGTRCRFSELQSFDNYLHHWVRPYIARAMNKTCFVVHSLPKLAEPKAAWYTESDLIKSLKMWIALLYRDNLFASSSPCFSIIPSWLTMIDANDKLHCLFSSNVTTLSIRSWRISQQWVAKAPYVMHK